MLDVLLPQRCVACGAAGEQVCERCLTRLPRIAAPLCARCGAPTAWPVERCRECTGRRLAFASARAAVEYDAAVKALVSAWKERGLRRLAEVAAALVEETVPRPPEAAALAFIPPDGDRSVKRGHHPAERLARELGKRWALPVVPLLARTGTLPAQRGLSLVERRRNVRNCAPSQPRRPIRGISQSPASSAAPMRRSACPAACPKSAAPCSSATGRRGVAHRPRP